MADQGNSALEYREALQWLWDAYCAEAEDGGLVDLGEDDGYLFHNRHIPHDFEDRVETLLGVRAG
jgi:hypothetical protein